MTMHLYAFRTCRIICVLKIILYSILFACFHFLMFVQPWVLRQTFRFYLKRSNTCFSNDSLEFLWWGMWPFTINRKWQNFKQCSTTPLTVPCQLRRFRNSFLRQFCQSLALRQQKRFTPLMRRGLRFWCLPPTHKLKRVPLLKQKSKSGIWFQKCFDDRGEEKAGRYVLSSIISQTQSFKSFTSFGPTLDDVHFIFTACHVK